MPGTPTLLQGNLICLDPIRFDLQEVATEDPFAGMLPGPMEFQLSFVSWWLLADIGHGGELSGCHSLASLPQIPKFTIFCHHGGKILKLVRFHVLRLAALFLIFSPVRSAIFS